MDSNKTINSNFNMQEMHVSSITMSTQIVGVWVKGVATVSIVDTNNNPVIDSTVFGVWSGSATNSVSGSTDIQGKITLYSSWAFILPFQSGTFTFTVTDVIKAEWIYNASANEVTSGSVTV